MIIKTSVGNITIQVEINISQNLNEQEIDEINATLTPVIHQFGAVLSGIIHSGAHAQTGIEILSTNLRNTAQSMIDILEKKQAEQIKTIH